MCLLNTMLRYAAINSSRMFTFYMEAYVLEAILTYCAYRCVYTQTRMFHVLSWHIALCLFTSCMSHPILCLPHLFLVH